MKKTSTHSRGDSPTPRRVVAQFRDTKTGRFTSKATWARSKSHGGTRYKRTYTPTEKFISQPKVEESLPVPSGKLSWIELMDVTNEKNFVSVYYSDRIRTTGKVDIATWALERREMRSELAAALGTSWEVITMWAIDSMSKDTVTAHAEEVEQDEEEEE